MKKFFGLILIIFTVFIVVACKTTSSDPITTTTGSTTTTTTSSKDEVKPVITGIANITIHLGEEFDPESGLKAEDNLDGDITDKVVVHIPEGLVLINGKITFSQVGDYTFTYKVKDSANNEAVLDRIITVIEPPIEDTTRPVFHGVNDVTLYEEDEFNPLENVTATDDIDGDLTQAIKLTLPSGLQLVNDKVIFNEKGTYTFTYEVVDTALNKTTVTRTVTVLEKEPEPVVDTTAPTLTGDDITVTVGEPFDVLQGIQAIDDVDGNITYKIITYLPNNLVVRNGKLSFGVEGTVSIDYKVIDNAGNFATLTRKVIVTGTLVEPEYVNLLNNSAMDSPRYSLITNGGAAKLNRASDSLTVDVYEVNAETNSVYLERNGVSLTEGFETSTWRVVGKLLGNLDNDNSIDVIIGYYNQTNEFIEIDKQPFTGTDLNPFTSPVTTTNGALRIVFKETGQFNLTQTLLQVSTNGANPNLIRDDAKGMGFNTPAYWYLASTVSGYSVNLIDDMLVVNALEANKNFKLQYENLELIKGINYTFSFKVKAENVNKFALTIGHDTQSTSVSRGLKDAQTSTIDVTNEWQTITLNYTALSSSTTFKISFTFNEIGIVYLDDFIVFETVGETVDETPPTITVPEDVVVVVGAEFDLLKDVTAFDLVDGDITDKLTYQLPSGLLENEGKVIFNEAGDYIITYNIVDKAGNATEIQRIITVLAQEPEKQNMAKNSNMEINKYELINQDSNAVIDRTTTNVKVDIAKINSSGLPYLERQGISFVTGIKSTTLRVKGTLADGLSNNMLDVILGYYDNNEFVEIYRETFTNDVLPEFTPNITTRDGILRIEFKEVGTFTLTEVLYQTGSAGVQNVIRDLAAGIGFMAPAYWNTGSSLSSCTVSVVDGMLLVDVNSTNDKKVIYENFTLKGDKEYEISFKVKANTETQFSFIAGTDSQDTSTSRLKGASFNVNASTEWQTVTFDYKTTTTSDMYKLLFTFNKVAKIYIDDLTIIEK